MSRQLMAMVAGLSVLAGGCGKRDPPKVTAGEVERKVAEAAGTAAAYARQEKDEYVARARKAIDEAQADVDRLRAEAARARADASGALRRRVEAMEERRRRAERKLGELESASGEAWKDLRLGVDRAVEDLKHPAASAGPPASSAAR